MLYICKVKQIKKQKMSTEIIILPAEVEQIAQNVSVEKRTEVQTVLNHVFNGVSKMREQLESVTVADENDKVNMKLANTIRLGVRQVRLESEKTFDAKRTEVQQQMLSFKTEDALWLKAKQTMQILTKEIEEQARFKEETKARFDAEQKELKIQQRMIKVVKVAPEMPRTEFENMSDETFALFFSGIEKAYNDRIEAERMAEEQRKEAEKKVTLHNERKEKTLPYFDFFTDSEKSLNFGEMSENEFISFFDVKKCKKAEFEQKQEAQRIENERLKKEAEEKEAQIKAERAEAEAKQKAIEEKARIEREEQEKKLQAERAEAKRIQDLKDAENARLQAELKARKDAGLKAQQEIERAEKEHLQAEAKAKKAPLKTKMNIWVDSFLLPEFEDNQISLDIKAKFEAFKKWSKSEIEKL